jgi:hypothetical protein
LVEDVVTSEAKVFGIGIGVWDGYKALFTKSITAD